REALESLPAFIAALGIERPVLVGHSDGGSIALIFAGAFPDVPRAVAVMAPHDFAEDETLAGIRVARGTSGQAPAKISPMLPPSLPPPRRRHHGRAAGAARTGHRPPPAGAHRSRACSPRGPAPAGGSRSG
ncbi:MAG: alpha/beta fold hydrolase, partial [Rhodocyclaceae bacterium]